MDSSQIPTEMKFESVGGFGEANRLWSQHNLNGLGEAGRLVVGISGLMGAERYCSGSQELEHVATGDSSRTGDDSEGHR